MSKIDWAKELGWSEEQMDDLTNAAYAYIRQGKYEVALPVMEALCLLNRNDAYYPQTLGALYLEMKKPKEAIAAFETALKLDADHAATLLNMTKALLDLNRTREALKLAHLLVNEKNAVISSSARALILAHESESSDS